MQFSIISTFAISAILGLAAASPGPLPEELNLFNGKETVTVVAGGGISRRDYSDLSTPVKRDNNINCKGSAFCERLGGSCDDAKRKVFPANTYGTFTGRVFSLLQREPS